jgi:hypothetical protein
MMVWIFLMITAQFCLLLAIISILVDIKRSLRDIDSHLGVLFNCVEKRLAQLTGRATWTGGKQL